MDTDIDKSTKDNYTKVKEILKKYNQEHLLLFYDELDINEKNNLLNQILEIDFDQILKLYDNSMIDIPLDKNTISPLPYFDKSKLSKKEINHYEEIGINFLKLNKYAVLTLAGGQGTRLGYNGPKGTYSLDFDTYKKSLFEIICDDLKKANSKFNISIPWLIMTSTENDSQTKVFFETNNYFNYPKEKVIFFKQGKLPIINVDKKLILTELGKIKEASNGNGDVFSALEREHLISFLEANNIEIIYFGGIDNIIQKNIDPLFIGLMLETNNKIASKSMFKMLPLEKTAVFSKVSNKPCILNYWDIDLNLSEKKDQDKNYLYRDANILSHLITLDAIKIICNKDLDYHRAYKKNAFINDEGMKQVPESPNTFKFETFIFDAFMYFDDMLLLRVNALDEFAPIKDFRGIYNPDTAKEKYLRVLAK